MRHLCERECTLQRRHQKLSRSRRRRASTPRCASGCSTPRVRMARAARYQSLGTFEFLVDRRRARHGDSLAFIEANPRLQVEHTVTEEVTGIDLVAAPARASRRARRSPSSGSAQGERAAPRGYAIQVRVNMETMARRRHARAGRRHADRLRAADRAGRARRHLRLRRLRTSPRFDSLLAKVIVHAPSPRLRRRRRASARARCASSAIEGVATNIAVPASACSSIPTSSPARVTRASSRSTSAESWRRRAAARRGSTSTVARRCAPRRPAARRTRARRRRGRPATIRSRCSRTAGARQSPEPRRRASSGRAGARGHRRGRARRCRAPS